MNLYNFHTHPDQLTGYRDAKTTVPEIAWDTAYSPEAKKKLEPLWAKDARYAYLYADTVLNKPWPPGEAIIATSPYYSYQYARHRIKGPWPPGEAAIATNARISYHYAKDFYRQAGNHPGRWLPGEAIIATSPEYAFYYAEFVIKGPWPPGEAAIATSPDYAYHYAADLLKGRFPAGEAAIATSTGRWPNGGYASKYKFLLQNPFAIRL